MLECDASNLAAGAILLQKANSEVMIGQEICQEMPFADNNVVGIYSYMLKKTELNSTTIKKELLALVKPMANFAHLLHTSEIRVLVVTYHKNLIALTNLILDPLAVGQRCHA
jgi:RNase H-like domain found in reverse transcriptase